MAMYFDIASDDDWDFADRGLAHGDDVCGMGPCLSAPSRTALNPKAPPFVPRELVEQRTEDAALGAGRPCRVAGTRCQAPQIRGPFDAMPMLRCCLGAAGGTAGSKAVRPSRRLMPLHVLSAL